MSLYVSVFTGKLTAGVESCLLGSISSGFLGLRVPNTGVEAPGTGMWKR